MSVPRTYDAVVAWRAAARHAAREYLQANGFALGSVGWWAGVLEVPVGDQFRAVPVGVSLPAQFPDALPIIRLSDRTIPRPIAHLESQDRLCLIQTHAATLDTSRPAEIVAEAMARATLVLSDALSGLSDDALHAEFLAYWERDTPRLPVTSMVTTTPGSLARALHVESVRAGKGASPRYWISDDGAQLAHWMRGRPEYRVDRADRSAFFLPIAVPLRPPDFSAPPTAREWWGTLKEVATPADWHAFEDWLARTALPPFLLVALAANGSPVATLFCTEFAGPPTLGRVLQHHARRNQRQRSSRASRLTGASEVAQSLDAPVRRVPLRRLDGAYLTRRGGALSLAEAVVCIVGCGAVGGHIAMQLGAMGVGTLHLVDPQHLKTENAHRHVLGMHDGEPLKVAALQAALDRMYPHQTARGHAEDIDALWRTNPDWLSSSHLIVYATGDEALERRAAALRWPLPAVHAWVEAFGAGGHVLTTAAGPSGCYECLFQTTAMGTIANFANLIAPDQPVAQTLAGCAGFHTPFSAMDAQRTALCASEAVVRLLLNPKTRSSLVTWRGDLDTVHKAGFALSPRGRTGGRGELEIAGVEWRDPHCPVCNDQAQGAAVDSTGQVAPGSPTTET